MKKENTISYILIVFMILLYFFTVKNEINPLVFLIATPLVCLYFFPIKMLIEIYKNKLTILSNIFASISIGLLIVYYYKVDNIMLDALRLIFLIINYYFIFKYVKINRGYAIMHLLLIFTLTVRNI